MESGGNQHSARLDEEMAGEAQSAESRGEDQPAGMFSIDPQDPGPNLSAAELDARSVLAQWLAPGHFPAGREQLIEAAVNARAPEEVVDAMRRLPAGRQFGNVGEAWRALGGREETPPD